MEQVLEKIIHFTDTAHGDQKRKYTPERYIVHPVRVMEICRRYSSDLSVHAAALLHDVLEDTPVSQDEIRQFLSGLMTTAQADKTLSMVIELTDVFIKKDYPHLNRRERKKLETDRLSKISPDAQTIKYADLIDNATDIIAHDPQFGKVFALEARALLALMKEGNNDLHRLAVQTIAGCLDKSVRKRTKNI